MIEYHATGKRFGSLEQAVREAEALLESLRDPAHTRRFYEDFDNSKILAGIAECPPRARIYTVVDLNDAGNLRIVTLEEDDALAAAREEAE